MSKCTMCGNQHGDGVECESCGHDPRMCQPENENEKISLEYIIEFLIFMRDSKKEVQK